MPHKKSQVTVFMILGLVILFTFMIALFLNTEINVEKIKSEKDPSLPVKNFVQNCLETVGDKAVERVLLQGGNYQLGTILENPKIYKLAKPVAQGQGIQNDINFSSDSINIGIKSFFSDTFAACINDFKNFSSHIDFADKAMLNVTVGDKSIKPSKTSSNINKFNILKTGKYKAILKYKVEDYYKIGKVISLSTFLTLVITIFVLKFRRYEK